MRDMSIPAWTTLRGQPPPATSPHLRRAKRPTHVPLPLPAQSSSSAAPSEDELQSRGSPDMLDEIDPSPPPLQSASQRRRRGGAAGPSARRATNGGGVAGDSNGGGTQSASAGAFSVRLVLTASIHGPQSLSSRHHRHHPPTGVHIPRARRKRRLVLERRRRGVSLTPTKAQPLRGPESPSQMLSRPALHVLPHPPKHPALAGPPRLPCQLSLAIFGGLDVCRSMGHRMARLAMGLTGGRVP